MIWCVEDDGSIRDIEMYALSSAGFEVRGFEDGTSFWEALKEASPELVILDIMLPGEDGLKLLARMKSSPEYRHIPVILATAKSQEYDRIRGLEMGAEDYLVKPFGVMEMVARVKAILRRLQPKPTGKVFRLAGLTLNLEERSVLVDDIRTQLTNKEFELLRLFLTHPGMVYSREQLFSQVWNTDYVGDSRTLDAHIRTLRQKLGSYGKQIETVRNVGYRWEL